MNKAASAETIGRMTEPVDLETHVDNLNGYCDYVVAQAESFASSPSNAGVRKIGCYAKMMVDSMRNALDHIASMDTVDDEKITLTVGIQQQCANRLIEGLNDVLGREHLTTDDIRKPQYALTTESEKTPLDKRWFDENLNGFGKTACEKIDDFIDPFLLANSNNSNQCRETKPNKCAQIRDKWDFGDSSIASHRQKTTRARSRRQSCKFDKAIKCEQMEENVEVQDADIAGWSIRAIRAAMQTAESAGKSVGKTVLGIACSAKRLL